MKNVIKDRDKEIESLKETIKYLSNKGEVNKLKEELSKCKKDYLDNNTKLVQKNKSLSKRNKALSEKNEKLVPEHATLLTYYYIIKEKISGYFRKLNNIEGDEHTQELDQWIVDEDSEQNDEDSEQDDEDSEQNDEDSKQNDEDSKQDDEDLEQKHEGDNQEAVKKQNEETKSDIIKIVKEEQIIKEQSDEINNSECFKILQYIHNILEKVDCKFERDITKIQLKAICKIMFLEGIYIDQWDCEYERMNLYANRPNDIKLMKFLSKYRLPDLNTLKIEAINCNVEKIVGLFIENSLPISLCYLFLNWSSKEELICNLLPYISMAVSKVSKMVNIYNVTINKEDFEQLLLACNSEIIYFFGCVISLPSAPDLSSISKSNIKKLSFNFFEIEVKPDVRWFESLVEGISKSKGIERSLDRILLSDCSIKKEETQEVMQRFKLNRVGVAFY